MQRTTGWSRRRVLAAAGAGALGLAPGSGQWAWARENATPAASALGLVPAGGVNGDGTWSFTDDRGVTTSREVTPTRVVAYIGIAAALHDLGFEVVGYFQGEEREATDIGKLAPDFPRETIPTVGYGDALDVERMIGLGVELFVGANYGVEGGQSIWPVDEDVIDQINQFAGVVAIAYADGTNTGRTIETVANLAAALGADLNAEPITTARSGFDQASDALADALAAKPGLTALYMSAWDSGFYVGRDLADINFYTEAGLTPYDPGNWDEQSWEVFARIPADIILLDNRGPQWWQPERLESDVAVWTSHPAVKVGQVYPWQNEYVPGYQGFTPLITGLTTAVSGAERLT